MENILRLKLFKEKELEMAQSQFLNNLISDFSIDQVNEKLINWYKMTWQEFKEELKASGSNISELKDDWEEYFNVQKKRIYELSREVKSIHNRMASFLDTLDKYY